MGKIGSSVISVGSSLRIFFKIAEDLLREIISRSVKSSSREKNSIESYGYFPAKKMRIFGAAAPLAERLRPATRVRQVVGSNPAGGTFFRNFRKVSKRPKTTQNGFRIMLDGV